MHRLTLIITMIALLAVPATAFASPEQIYADCEDNGRLDSRYSDADLRDSLRDIPQDLDEYSNCSELIRGALTGVDTSGGDPTRPGAAAGAGGTGGGPDGRPQGNGVGSVPLDPKGNPLDPRVDAEPQEKTAVSDAAAGRDLRPTSAGVRPGEADGDLPAPVIAFLILAGLAALAAGAATIKQLVVGRPA